MRRARGADPPIRPHPAVGDELPEVVRRCPSGALRYTLASTASPAEPPAAVCAHLIRDLETL